MSDYTSSFPILVLDASTGCLQTGILKESGKWASFETSDHEVLSAISIEIRNVLKQSQLEIEQLDTIYLCEGPGSLLGIRLTAMVARTWLNIPSLKHLKVFTYSSLRLAEQILRKETQALPTPPYGITSRSRLKHVNLMTRHHRENNSGEQWSECSESDLAEIPYPIYRIQSKPDHTGCMPKNPIHYELRDHPDLLSRPTGLKRTSEPNPVKLHHPNYKKWDAQRHRAKQ